MNSDGPTGQQQTEEQDKQGRGLNLALVYSLLGAALIIATGIAALIVLPFYHRH
jgi:FtsH-binding integral membrane protein